MGNICPCPKRRKEKEFAYDVHEETFEMEENAQNIGEHSPKNQPHDQHDNNVLTEQLRSSEEGLEKLPETQYEKSHSNKLISSFANNELEKTNKSQSQATTLHGMDEELKEAEKLNQMFKPQEVPVPVVEEKPKYLANILKPKTVKKKYNPDDYRFLNETQSFKVKKIDSIKQQQFNIDKCKDCQFFIFDITANIYIDDCQNCFIFIAPCESTIFVRSCKNMVIIAATKQFRTYQCHNSTFSLYCKSQPVVESSSQLVFTSFSCPIYQQLQKQAAKQRFEPWNNHWSEIHNFTKKEGEVHYKLKQTVDFSKINWARAFQQAEIAQTQLENPFPLILGDLPYQTNRQVVILINKNVNNQQIRKMLKGTTILKAFQGVITGHGKQQQRVLLIDPLDNIIEKYEEIGTVFTDPDQVQQKKNAWFISFGDQRQK